MQALLAHDRATDVHGRTQLAGAAKHRVYRVRPDRLGAALSSSGSSSWRRVEAYLAELANQEQTRRASHLVPASVADREALETSTREDHAADLVAGASRVDSPPEPGPASPSRARRSRRARRGSISER